MRRLLLILLVAALICAALATVLVWRAVHDPIISPSIGTDTTFVKIWSTDRPGRYEVYDLAPAPGGIGGLYVLAGDYFHRYVYLFDANGSLQNRFEVSSIAHRIATGADGATPFIAIVSSRPRVVRITSSSGSKQPADVEVQANNHLHLYDAGGRELWKRQLGVGAGEPLITVREGRPVVVLSTGERILCYGIEGTLLWDVELWHHTLASGSVHRGGPAFLLAALAPRLDIVRIDGSGAVIGPWAAVTGPWATSENPSRLATVSMPGGGIAAVTLRGVRGPDKELRQVVTFFDGGGAALNEVELPSSATPLPYSRIEIMDAGTGPFWVIVFGDGAIHAFSRQGRRLATDETGLRLVASTAIPRRGRSSLLVTVGGGGIVAWSANPATLRW